MQDNSTNLPTEMIETKIYFIRGKKVMLDSDLSTLYQVETKALTRAARRNIERFPRDFMFQLTIAEAESLRCQIGTSNEKRGGRRYLPYVFTEQGIAMLSSVLHSKRAILVNIQIMRTFTKLREMLVSNRELREKIEKMEQKYDQQFKVVFQVIKSLIAPESKSKRNIGFRT